MLLQQEDALPEMRREYTININIIRTGASSSGIGR
jgi:hypothetical protein